MFNMVLWIYRRAWKCLVIEIWQGFEYVMDTENSECARVCSWIMLEQTFLEKKLFPNIRVVLAILLYNSLLKMNYLYYQFWTKESLSFSEAVARKCSMKKLRVKFCQNSLATLLKKRLRHRCIFVNLAKICKNAVLQNNCKWLVLDFAQFYMSHSIIYFIKRIIKKRNFYFLNVFNRISTSENYRQKK